jgi:peptide/nickel transport system ATP-binding protein
MYLGRIVEQGPTERIFARPAHPYTQALLASIPSIDPARRERSAPAVAGDVPSPSSPPSGCAFHTRCPSVQDRCRRALPELYPVEAGRSRCFLSDPVDPLPRRDLRP